MTGNVKIHNCPQYNIDSCRKHFAIDPNTFWVHWETMMSYSIIHPEDLVQCPRVPPPKHPFFLCILWR